jgi:hypothetical protein
MTVIYNIVSIAILLSVFAACSLWAPRPKRRKVIAINDVSANEVSVVKQYSWLLERIQEAASLKELQWCEDQAMRFEAHHKPYYDCSEMYLDLMKELHQKELQLHREVSLVE